MNGDSSARNKSMPAWSREPKGQLSGPASPAIEAPLLGVWLGLKLVSWAILYLPAELLPFGQLLRLETLGGRCAHSLSCPELRDGRSANPGYCLWCLPTVFLQPSSTPCLQGLFPNSCSNHTPRFREEPLLFLPPSLIRGGTEEEG